MSRYAEQWEMPEGLALVAYDEFDTTAVGRAWMHQLLLAAGGRLRLPDDPDAQLIERVKAQFGDSGHSFMSDADARRIIAVVRGAA